MRNTRPVWPQVVGFLALAALMWWGTNELQPDPGQVEQLSWSKLARSVIDGDVKARGEQEARAQGLEDPRLVVGHLHTVWGPGCDVAARPLLDKRVRVQPGLPRVLAVECGRTGAHATLTATLTDADGDGPSTFSKTVRIPDGESLLPPLFAVLIALFTRQVLASLLAAIILGALFTAEGELWTAAELTVNDYLWQGASDPFNLYIFGFTLVLIGMVHVSIAMGGMQGVLRLLTKRAKTVRSTQLTTAAMGIAVFFDDYANSVIVGSSARPLTDAQRISREKLAYIVDSTAAPIAGIALISTWIGYEIGLFESELSSIGHIASSGYDFFFEVLPYRFYCFFAVALVFIIAWTGRDFGPMRRAEARARASGLVAPQEESAGRIVETTMKAGAPARWINGILPIAVVILGAFAAFVIVGAERLASDPDTPRQISWLSWSDLSAAFTAVGDDNVAVLFWAAVGGCGTAIVLAAVQRLLTPMEIARAWFRGVRSMAPAIVILILAIGIRQVTDDLGTERFLGGLLSDVALWSLPLTTFVLAAAIAFATGTSWGTMGILLPVAIPLAAGLVGAGGPDIIIVLVAGSVLDGAIFGDHCSLISDTTVMSSMASSCHHVEHVRTQFPYALLAMSIAGLAGYLLTALQLGLPVWVSYLLGVLLLWGFVRLVGRRTSPAPSQEARGGAPDA